MSLNPQIRPHSIHKRPTARLRRPRKDGNHQFLELIAEPGGFVAEEVGFAGPGCHYVDYDVRLGCGEKGGDGVHGVEEELF